MTFLQLNTHTHTFSLCNMLIFFISICLLLYLFYFIYFLFDTRCLIPCFLSLLYLFVFFILLEYSYNLSMIYIKFFPPLRAIIEQCSIIYSLFNLTYLFCFILTYFLRKLFQKIFAILYKCLHFRTKFRCIILLPSYL